MAHIHVKRVYEAPDERDGTRILVDRLWPRGLAKADAQIDLWRQDLAPSDALRRWYGHQPDRFRSFARKYRAELEEASAAIEQLRESVDLRRRITLLTATKELEFSHATVLRSHLKTRL